MNVVKCKNGHFFDGEKYASCPHCGESVDNNAAQQANTRDGDKKRFSWGKKEKSASENKQFEYTGESVTTILEEDISPKTEILHVEDKPETQKSEPEQLTAQSPLKAAVQKASANTEGKTMSYFSAATSGASNGATQKPQNTATDPVVGWLVCIGGNHFGESFNIGAGKNSIGRNDENKIILDKDNKVSRSKHALITYEPKKRNFYLQPGDSSGLTYLNDDYIDESKKLGARDIIEIGDSKFIFVPLCDETFSWEDFITKE